MEKRKKVALITFFIGLVPLIIGTIWTITAYNLFMSTNPDPYAPIPLSVIIPIIPIAIGSIIIAISGVIMGVQRAFMPN